MPKRCASVFGIVHNEAVADYRDAVFCNINGHGLMEGGTRKQHARCRKVLQKPAGLDRKRDVIFRRDFFVHAMHGNSGLACDVPRCTRADQDFLQKAISTKNGAAGGLQNRRHHVGGPLVDPEGSGQDEGVAC